MIIPKIHLHTLDGEATYEGYSPLPVVLDFKQFELGREVATNSVDFMFDECIRGAQTIVACSLEFNWPDGARDVISAAEFVTPVRVGAGTTVVIRKGSIPVPRGFLDGALA